MLNNSESILDFTIKSYESDLQGNMSLPAFFLFLQECAWENAKQNNFGYEFVEKEGALWVLSKVKLKIDQYPKWKERINIRTWPRKPEGLFAMRDYQLMSEGQVIGSVSSYWLVLDKKTKRPRRISDFDFAHYDFIPERALEESLTKIKVEKDVIEIDRRKVYASDIDVNGHVNNATYVKWIMDAHSLNRTKQIQSFEIHFLSELYLNDSFVISHIVKRDGHQYILLNPLTQKTICHAELS